MNKNEYVLKNKEILRTRITENIGALLIDNISFGNKQIDVNFKNIPMFIGNSQIHYIESITRFKLDSINTGGNSGIALLFIDW